MSTLLHSAAKSPKLLRASHYAQERAEVQAALAQLTNLTAHSPNVFASPLGPFHHRRELFLLPRHLFFGEITAEEVWRVGIYAGLSGTDTRSMLASVRALDRFIFEPGLGRNFNLVFHSNVNPSGLADGTSLTRDGQDLQGSSWANPSAPELQLLERDILAMQYHGLIIIRTDPTIAELHGWLRGFSPDDPFLQGVQLIKENKPRYLPFQFPVKWEPHPEGRDTRTGPLTLADDLRMRPFEVTLRVPADPASEWAVQAVGHTLRVFLNNFRTAASTGLNI